MVEPESLQEAANVWRNSVFVLSTLRVTSRAICVNASNEQVMIICNRYRRGTNEKMLLNRPTIVVISHLRIVISLYDMNCLTEDNCRDRSLSTCICKEVEKAVCNANDCCCKCPNRLSEAFPVSNRRNRSSGAVLVSVTWAEPVLVVSSVMYLFKYGTICSCNDVTADTYAKRREVYIYNWMYHFWLLRIEMFEIRIRLMHAWYCQSDFTPLSRRP